MRAQRTCKACKRPFYPKTDSQSYCSIPCARTARTMSVEPLWRQRRLPAAGITNQLTSY